MTADLLKMIGSIPGWSDLKKSHLITKKSSTKYFNTHIWLKVVKQRWAELEGVVTPESTVLDIGTGFGYFPLYGLHHNKAAVIEAVDMPDELYDTVTALLDVSKHELTVEAFTLLNLTRQYDVVTAYRMAFDRTWGEAEWRFFLRDVYDNLLNEGGSLVLGFNDGRDRRFVRWAGKQRRLNSRDMLLSYEVIEELCV
jgi:hypothetical protein